MFLGKQAGGKRETSSVPREGAMETPPGGQLLLFRVAQQARGGRVYYRPMQFDKRVRASVMG